MELLATSFTTLFVAFGPVETALIFGALTRGVHRPERFRLASQATVIAGIVLTFFAVLGPSLFEALQVSLDAFRVAGGILLLLQAIDLIFAHPTGLSSLTPREQREAAEPGEIAVFPLAFPVIAGPASLTAVVLLMGRAQGDLVASAVVVTCMILCLVATYVCMLFTEVISRVLRTTGANVIARLSGVILAALAVQFIFDGIRGARLFS